MSTIPTLTCPTCGHLLWDQGTEWVPPTPLPEVSAACQACGHAWLPVGGMPKACEKCGSTRLVVSYSTGGG